mmetsp:Transcript_12664/g.23860  ORF Transcript_12664/g.23860 Transcript_12664/m.23860 type:complete len:248 (+) Transcript_12664:96-839(+)
MDLSSGVVCVCTVGGTEIQLEVASACTVSELKAQLLAKMDGIFRFTLLHGTETLEDDWVLAEHGITDGSVLTQVMLRLPCGTFEFESDALNAPAGRNTSAVLHAIFELDGTFKLTVREREVTSLIIGEDFDPYKSRAAFLQEYTGRVQGAQDLEFVVTDLRCTRKGHFREPEPEELAGRGCETSDQSINLKVPFAAGGCNEGVAGLKWVTLWRSRPHESDPKDTRTPVARLLDLHPSSSSQTRCALQ